MPVNALNNYNDTAPKDTYHFVQRLIIQIIVGYTYHDRIFQGQHPLTVFSSTYFLFWICLPKTVFKWSIFQCPKYMWLICGILRISWYLLKILNKDIQFLCTVYFIYRSFILSFSTKIQSKVAFSPYYLCGWKLEKRLREFHHQVPH